MAVSWSQLLFGTVDTNCYDLGHPWSRSCLYGIYVIGVSSVRYSFKTYCAVYLLSSLIQGKLLKPSHWKKIIQDIVRSTIFLSWNGCAFIGSLCLLRWMLKCFYYSTVSFFPGLIASFTAILWERKARRQLLTVYMLNTVSEIVYRALQSRNLFRPIPHGEVLLFSLTMAAFLYLYKKRDTSKDFISGILSFLIGPHEGGKPSNSSQESKSTSPVAKKKPFSEFLHHAPVVKTVASTFNGLLQQFKLLNSLLQRGMKHDSCLHDSSCVYYWITGFLKPFFYGYGGQVAVNLMTSIKRLRRRPTESLKRALSSQTVQLGLCMGLFCGSFKMINCLLRWYNNQDDAYYGFVGGFIAGSALLIYPAPAVASYLFWKLVERLYIKGAEAGYLPQIPYGIEALYAVLTACMFHVAVFEPHNLKLSYWNFLKGLTNSRMEEINRQALVVFGVDGSRFKPLKYKLDPQYTSDAMKKFVER